MLKKKQEQEIIKESEELLQTAELQEPEVAEQSEEKEQPTQEPKAAKKQVKTNGNGHTDSSELTTLLKQSIKNQEEIRERLEELEKKNSTVMADAHIKMVNFTYDTDDDHLPELTRIPLMAARPHALGMMLESLMDADVIDGTTPLSKKLRNYYFRLMRSVGGIHLGRGVRLAEEQASAEQEKEDELELGGNK